MTPDPGPQSDPTADPMADPMTDTPPDPMTDPMSGSVPGPMSGSIPGPMPSPAPTTKEPSRRTTASTRAANQRADAEQAAAVRAADLATVGLSPGEAVRFRRRVSARWIPATVERVERDGSVGLRDPKGAAVALTVDRIEVRTLGPRGRLLWEPLTDRLARNEQLRLL